jgi:hypothetical protein
MPNFNNCRVAIVLKDNSLMKFDRPVRIKDAADTAIIVNNSTAFHAGISGSTGSSFNIINSKRGIQVQNNGRVDIENANIKNVQYGFVSLGRSSFDLNKCTIDGNSYTSFTGQAYGMYVSDGSIGNAFTTSVTGYAGGTASLTGGNVAVVKNSILFVGTTADSLRVNTSAINQTLAGQVFVDTTLGKKIIGSDAVASLAGDEA